MMEKLDEVIRALESCADLDRSCDDCSYEGDEYCEVALMKDALRILKMWDVLHKDLWDRTHEIVRLKKELKAVRAERDAALEKLSWLVEKPVPMDNGEYVQDAPKEGM